MITIQMRLNYANFPLNLVVLETDPDVAATQKALGIQAAKYALGKALEDCQQSNVEIRKNTLKKPYLFVNEKSYPVSISHSGKFAAAITFPNDCKCGIDLESIEDFAYPNLAKYLDCIESQTLPTSNTLTECEKTLLYWTAKESLIKAIPSAETIEFKKLKIKEIQILNNSEFICSYQEFPNYFSKIFLFEKFILSLALPKIGDLNEKLI